MRKDIVALILAGGKSTRFWPLSDKNLINFIGENLLEHHIKVLSSLGIKDFVVVCSADVAVFLRVKSKKPEKITISRILQEKNQGIGQAVLLANDLIREKYPDRPVYIINSDDLYDDYLHQEILNLLFKKDFQIGVGAYETELYQPLGYFVLDKDSICGIVEKPKPGQLPSNLANMSLHLYRNFTRIIEILNNEAKKSDVNDDLYERALNILFRSQPVTKVIYKGMWQILKYPWNVLSVSDYFLKTIKQSISDKASVDKTAKITGPVIIEDGVKILEFARILGPTLIKKGTIIGTGSLVRESIIGENCVVGYNTGVTRSYVGNNCWFHTNYIGDSVLGNNVNMGSGAVLANLRLDQKNIFSQVGDTKINTGKIKLGAIAGNGVQIGVNACIMPGVKIGKNSVVGPGVTLNQDLEDNTVLLSIQQQVKKKSNVNLTPAIRKHFRELLK